jgi:CBS domain-containing protein
MKAREIMTASPYVVMADEPIGRAAELMLRHDVGLIPVVDDYSNLHLEGVITDRDIAVRHVAFPHTGDCIVRDHMTKGSLEVVRSDDHVHDVIGRMRKQQLRRMPVVDADHRVLGVIAQADIARRIGPEEPVLVDLLLESISEPAGR